ncbi:MAG TPA: hypothetical protein VN428_05725, partial [Bryobacteraceae bacterium]|nr:hypothetical protein [Bryobacteraceae bacterium]
MVQQKDSTSAAYGAVLSLPPWPRVARPLLAAGPGTPARPVLEAQLPIPAERRKARVAASSAVHRIGAAAFVRQAFRSGRPLGEFEFSV